MPTPATLLEITGINLGDYSARGLTMQLQPIGGGELAYDVYGNLHDLTLPQFQKYSISISCTDVNAPNLTDVWRGKEVFMVCLPGQYIGVYDLTNTDADASLELYAMVNDWRTNFDEYGKRTGWSIDFIQSR